MCFPSSDICSFVWSAQFGCLHFEEAARKGWWYGIRNWYFLLFIPHLHHVSCFLPCAVINAGVAGCCTGLALSFPGIFHSNQHLKQYDQSPFSMSPDTLAFVLAMYFHCVSLMPPFPKTHLPPLKGNMYQNSVFMSC